MRPVEDSSGPKEEAGRLRRSLREGLRFGAVALLIRAAVLAVDSTPRYFLGDSASYLATSLAHYVPNDRSWVYGLAVNGLLDLTHRLLAVTVAQSALSALACTLAAVLLRGLGVRPVLAWLALALLSLEPMLFYYDRSIMTDAPGAAFAWMAIALTAAALTRGGAWRWALAAAGLWATTVLRTALVPLVLFVPAFAVAARAVLAWRAGGPWRARAARLAGALGFAGAVAAGLVAYAVTTGRLTHSPPQLNPLNGYFLLGTTAPILTPEDFQGLPLRDPAALLRESDAKGWRKRNAQIYHPEGLAQRIQVELGSWLSTSQAGALISSRAIRRDPLGFAGLAARSAAEYLSAGPYRSILEGELGLKIPLDQGTVEALNEKVHEHVIPSSPWAESPLLSVMRRWAHALPLLAWLAVLAPALALAALRRLPGARPAVLLVAACCWLQFAATTFFCVTLVPRYLLPLTPMAVTLLALACDGWLRRPPRGAPEAAGGPPHPPAG